MIRNSLYQWRQNMDGIMILFLAMPIPPMRVGRKSRSLKESLMVEMPVTAGISL